MNSSTRAQRLRLPWSMRRETPRAPRWALLTGGPGGPPLVAVIVAVGVLIRSALVAGLAGGAGPARDSDSRDYLLLAHHLGQLLTPPRGLLSLTVFHPPGYPAVVRLGEVFGGTVGVLAMQVVLAGITLVATFAVGRRLGGQAAGVVALVIVALEPLSVLYTGLLMSETVFTALLMCSVWALLCAWRSASWRWILLAGFLLGLSVLIRPVALYLPVVLVPVTVAVVSQSRGRKALMAAALLIGFCVPVGAWVVRNAEIAGGPMVSSVDSYNLLAYRAAGAVAAETGVTMDEASRALTDQLRSRVRPGDSEYAIAAVERDQALRIIRQHPRGLVISSARGFAHVVLAPGLGVVDATSPDLPRPVRTLLALYAGGIAVAVILGALAGALLLLRRGRWRVALGVIAVAFYLIVVSSGPEGESRFRVPILPLLAVLAGPALVALGGDLSRRRRHSGREIVGRQASQGAAQA